MAIFGGGRVGTAMSAEMPSIPVIRRGQDCECDIACICWPAQAIKDFTGAHPLGGKAIKVAFCNGAWAVEEGADYAGICYVHAVEVGDRGGVGKESWRVGNKSIATILQAYGLGVLCARGIEKLIWAKLLFLLPVAIATLETGLPTREAAKTVEQAAWYSIVRDASVAAIGEEDTVSSESRVKFLLGRVPSRQLIRDDETRYFMEKLTCSSK